MNRVIWYTKIHVLLILYASNLKSSDNATIVIVYMVKSEP